MIYLSPKMLQNLTYSLVASGDSSDCHVAGAGEFGIVVAAADSWKVSGHQTVEVVAVLDEK